MVDFVDVSSTEDPNVETLEYIEKMTSLVDGEENPGEEQPLLAGKYTSEADLEKGVLELLKKQKGGNLEDYYKELERGLGKASPGEMAPKSTPNPVEDGSKQPKEETQEDTEKETVPPTDGDDSKTESGAKSGVDFGKLSQEFFETGELSETSYKSLGKAGIPKEMVDAYIEGQKALAEKLTNEVTSIAGGQDHYVRMLDWAKASFSEAEISSFNQAIMSGNPASMKLAVRGLKAAYIEANGSTPKLVKGTSSSSQSSDVYTSWSDVMADMGKPEYHSVESFRNAVAKKIERSNL